MTNLDKWCADQCKITIEQGHGPYCKGTYIWQEHGAASICWTIQDPRCREIIFDHFNKEDKYQDYIDDFLIRVEQGMEIGPAMIDCITKIWEESCK